MSNENKRKFPRADYPCYLTLWQGNGYETIMAQTSNIGAGGILLHLNRSFMIGSKIEVKIDFTDQITFQCSGLVLRCQQNREDSDERKGLYSVAIIFEGLDEAKTAHLKELVDNLINSQGH
jgi:hypothetical protein